MVAWSEENRERLMLREIIKEERPTRMDVTSSVVALHAYMAYSACMIGQVVYIVSMTRVPVD